MPDGAKWWRNRKPIGLTEKEGFRERGDLVLAVLEAAALPLVEAESLFVGGFADSLYRGGGDGLYRGGGDGLAQNGGVGFERSVWLQSASKLTCQASGS